MAPVVLKKPVKKPTLQPLADIDNIAELLQRLGGVPLDRIRCNPPLGTATEHDVIHLLESADKTICELIDGVLVEKPMGFKESHIVAVLIQYLMNYLDENDLGIAFSPDGPVRIRPGRIRFPDTGFISWKRLPGGEFPEDKILNVMPELAVEVLSESNTIKEMELKLDDYFQSGVKLVWIVDPELETIKVYTSRNAKKTLTSDHVLEGGKILPGFSLPVKKLFTRIHHRKKKN